ncbi:ATP-binding protein [Bradyrhizobium sp. Ash2021]|uniref:ATP-binding protein n=1 Tax=Bradyrhizobium sp. Ash2021 TaxID=2954771 RepID=UPI002814B66D|nr:ATP-binding protein [Bradyrhizobium sp. Ash2021]WMT77033.1 ATP-binding protein [Bradyrhizobium sp. Ash2021]
MKLENKASEIGRIAKAFQAISKEISYEGLAKALLKAALDYCGAARGAVLLSEKGELLAKADASFPRERARFFVSEPAAGDFRLLPDISERVLARQEIVVRQDCWKGSALVDPAECPPGQNIAQLFLPLIHQDRTIGVLYLESERKETFTPGCISVISMLASQAAASFESTQLFEALRETNSWMIKGQQIGRMGSYRWNTRTLLSRASRECYRIFDIDLDVNPVPFEVFKSRVYPDDINALEQALREAVSTKSPFSHEYRVVHRDSSILHVVAVGQFDLGPTGDVELEGIITDITEWKAAEHALTDVRNELARAVRLASLGELAGSVIHEINQPLTGIIMSAEACLRWLARDPAEPSEARKSAMRVIEQGRRASDIVTGLRYLVRDARIRFSEVEINDAIDEILLLLKRDIERADVTLRTALDNSIPTVEGDRVQLQQVVHNLVRNAIDAMTTVSGRPRVLTASSKVADGCVFVSIADAGVGIASTSRERLFDPLYTTKGDGLGLGLSICRKIIAVHGGGLWVEEDTAHGATFTFTVPLRQSASVPGSA